MKSIAIEDVSDILDTFDLEEISDLLQRQVTLRDNDPTDYFHPLYYKYKEMMESEENSDLMKEDATDRFTDVCNLFLHYICKEFHLGIDSIWLEDHQDQLPGLVIALYSFFIKDLKANIQEVCLRYIKERKDEIFKIFEDRRTKKDASSLVAKRSIPIELAVIVANIYDTSTWILQQLSEESFLDYLNEDYVPLQVIRGLMEDGILGGEYMETIQEIYESCINMKSEICLNIVQNFNIK